VEKVEGQQSICCGDRGNDDALGCGVCSLENERNNWSGTRRQRKTINLEGGGKLVVLLRAEQKLVMRVRKRA